MSFGATFDTLLYLQNAQGQNITATAGGTTCSDDTCNVLQSQVATRLAANIESVESDLAGAGRVLLRPSGTEAVIRVMAEAPTEAQASAAVDALVAAVEALS